MPSSNRKLRVFLCHASQDKSIVQELHQKLFAEGWIDPWLDQEKLLPGHDWNLEIEKAVEATDAVIVFLSENSVTKEGYVQKELRKVLNVADEKPEGTIFIIPLRLDNCEVPRSLKKWQTLDYFPADYREQSYKRLLQGLVMRANRIGIYEHGQCYKCNEPILSFQPWGECLYCRTSYHEKCWKENIGCYRMGCEGNYKVEYFYQQKTASESVVKMGPLPVELQSAVSQKQSQNPDLHDDWKYWIHLGDSEIFEERLRKAFPRLRTPQTIHGKEAAERLEILLRRPLTMRLPESSGLREPFWWFRSNSNSYIEKFERLRPSHILLNEHELEIDYITAVRKFSDEERNFVYVHVLPDEPTGVYNYEPGWLSEYLQEQLDKGYGYYFYEGYGIWRGHFVTWEELQDGAALIDGQPTDIPDVKYRRRYLTPYNFVICGKDHLLNDTRIDRPIGKLLNDILLGTKTVDDLIDFVEALPRSPRFFRG